MRIFIFCFLVLIATNSLRGQFTASNKLINSFLQEGNNQFKQKNYDKALIELKKALKFQQNSLLNNHTELGVIYSLMGECYYKLKKIRKAKNEFKKAKYELELGLQIQIDSLGISHKKVTNTNDALVAIYKKLGQDYENSIFSKYQIKNGRAWGDFEEYQKELEYCKTEYGDDHLETAKAHLNLARHYRYSKKYKHSEKHYIEALKIKENELSKYTDARSFRTRSASSDVSNICGSLSEYYDEIGKYNLAEKYRKKSLALREKNLKDQLKQLKVDIKKYQNKYGENHLKTDTVLYGIGYTYLMLKKYKKAKTAFETSLQIRIDSLGLDHKDTRRCYQWLKITYKKLNYNTKDNAFAHYQIRKPPPPRSSLGLDYEKRLLREIENCTVEYGVKHLKTAEAYDKLGERYLSVKEFEKARKQLEIALKIRFELLETSHKDLSSTNEKLKTIYSKLNIPPSPLAQNATAAISNFKLQRENINNLRKKVIFYMRSGNNDLALKYSYKGLELSKSCWGKSHKKVSDWYKWTAGIHKRKNNFEQCRELLQKSLSIALSNKNSNQMISIYETMGDTYQDEGNYLQAIDWYKKMIVEEEKRLKSTGYMSFSLFSIHRKVGNIYLCNGEYNKAIYYFKELQKYRDEDVNNRRTSENYNSLESEPLLHSYEHYGNFRVASIHAMTGNYEMADSIWKTLFPNWINGLWISSLHNYNFSHEKKSRHEGTINPFFRFAIKHQDSATLELAADLMLNVKSINLGYEKTQKVNAIKTKEYQEMIDSMLNSGGVVLTEKVFDETNKEQQRHIQFIKQQPIKWRNVKKKLQSDHLIVDFLHFPLNASECDIKELPYVYYAILTHKDFTSPKFIQITDEKILSELLKADISERPNYIYKESTRKALYQILWQPLKPYLEDVKTVHISPSGILHRIPFESLKDTEDEYLAARYEFHYYSAIRDMLKEKPQKNTYEDILLMGHILYDLDEKDKYEDMLASTDTLRSTREGVPPIPGTLNEVLEIKHTGKKAGLKTTLLTIDAASEDKVQTFVGKRAPSIIHFATHGVFLPPLEKRHRKHELIGIQDSLRAADNPLKRSALMLYGANETWTKGRPILGSGEDGILTALEVTALDLQNTNLVVLSACSTGLGNVHNTEGVFGLQRAFKLAGVDYVVASLWDVDDKATKDLMVEFYKNLLERKQDPATALRNAKRKFMKDDPELWAGFILIE